MIDLQEKQKLRRFFKELPKRQKSLEKKVIKRMAETLMEKVVSAGTPDDIRKDYGFAYTGQLALMEVQADNSSAAVLYIGPKTMAAENLDPERAILLLGGVNRDTPRNQAIFESLKQFEPYTLKTFPAKIKADDFILTYEKASEARVIETITKNKSDIVQLATLLKPLGIIIDREQFEDIRKLKVLSDLAFRILQHELKTKNEPKPVWIPAMREIQKKAFLQKLLSEPSTVRILADPSYTSHQLSGKIGLKVSQQSVQSTADFMKYLQQSSTIQG